LDMKLFEKRPDAANGSTWDVHWTDAPLGHEVQAAKTADGKSIVVKYIDFRDSTIKLDAPYGVYVYDRDNETYVADQVEYVTCTDIFLTHRKLNEVEFSPVVNATNDLYYQKISRMPDVVESVNEVGLFIHRFPLHVKTMADYSPQLGAIPDAICQQMGEFFQLVDFCTLDADHEPTGEVGVETKFDYDFRIDNVYPNPATDNAEIVFVLDKSSNVTIDMFDVVGHKTNLRKGFETKGAHVFSINTADYPTGSYIITMTVEGRRVAKSINIVK